jgi:DNA polymerase-3 subunit delta
MRYTNLQSFQKHLASSAPLHLSPLYVVASTDDFERKVALDSILSYLKKPDSLVTYLREDEAGLKQVQDALNSPSFFGGAPIVVVPEADKKLLDSLTEISFGTLILGTKQKGITGKIEAAGVILDLTEEKPWEREKRWIAKLHEKARNAGKRLNEDAALLLLAMLDADAALLDHEMDKLLSYAADKTQIDRAAIESVCVKSKSYTLWQVAEDLVWDKVFHADAEIYDSFHGLVASIRGQLAIGAKMCALHESGVPSLEWGGYFPKIWPKALEKKSRVACQEGSDYFRKGLDRLFEVELLAKSGAVPLDALFDSYRLKLQYAK